MAADYVYQFKRVARSALEESALADDRSAKIIGLAEARKRGAGERQVRLRHRRSKASARWIATRSRSGSPSRAPRFYENLTDARIFGAVAREVVEAYPDEIMGKPVGTGPFRLASWMRSSRIVLERSPTYREEFYDASPAADDVEGQAIMARLKGRKLPHGGSGRDLDHRGEPAALALIPQRQQDTINIPARVHQRRGAKRQARAGAGEARHPVAPDAERQSDVVITYFNMEDPMVGGYTPDKVALRRAISLGYNVERRDPHDPARPDESRAVAGAAADLSGYDDAFISEMGEFDRARASALLDTYGYVDRDGDGWREQPDGSPWCWRYATRVEPDSTAHSTRCGSGSSTRSASRVEFNVNQWPENAKNARGGKLMMWGLGWSADGLGRRRLPGPGNSRDIGGSQLRALQARRVRRDSTTCSASCPTARSATAAMHEMKRLFVAYMPYKVHGHRYHRTTYRIPGSSAIAGTRSARDFFK